MTKTSQNKLFLMPKQDRFIFSECKYPAFVAGLGSGKTWAGCIKALIKAGAGEDGVIVAPTYTMLRDVTQRTFFEILHSHNQEYEFNKTEGVLHYKGATIFFRSGDKPDRLRGININWAYLDEAALMREEVWKIIIGRLRVGEKPQAWITTTPAGFNWVYDYWVSRESDSYEIIHSSSHENIHLPEEYLGDLVDTYTGEYAKQEIEGDFVAFEGLVYLECSRNVHVIDNFDIPESWKRVRGIDYGYTNPFVCLWGALDEDDRLYIYDEHYRKKTLIKDHADAIASRGGTYLWTVADHDAQANAEMQQHGIITRNAQKEVIAGIQKVKARLKVQPDGKPRLFFLANCPQTIKEAGMYRWAESKIGRNVNEEPVKEHDHAMDTLRYMVMEIDNQGFVYV